jgi:hypothetical protein
MRRRRSRRRRKRRSSSSSRRRRRRTLVTMKMQGKGKAVPLQAWSGPEGSRKLRFPDFMTTAQDGGKVVSPTHRPALPPGNTPCTYFIHENAA